MQLFHFPSSKIKQDHLTCLANFFLMNHLSKIDQCTGLPFDSFTKYPGNISFDAFF